MVLAFPVIFLCRLRPAFASARSRETLLFDAGKIIPVEPGIH